jgi:hypothetical protein
MVSIYNFALFLMLGSVFGVSNMVTDELVATPLNQSLPESASPTSENGALGQDSVLLDQESAAADTAEKFNLTESQEQQIIESDALAASASTDTELQQAEQESEASLLSSSPVRVSCNFYKEFEVQLCLPSNWVLNKEVYNTTTGDFKTNLNTSLNLEVRPCYVMSNKDCITRPVSSESMLVYPPPTFGSSAIPLLRYNITEVTTGSETLGDDTIIGHLENRVRELSTDNFTIINQIAPATLDGMNAFKISYYQKAPHVQVMVPNGLTEEAVPEFQMDSTKNSNNPVAPSTRSTEVIAAGNGRIYEISYSVPVSFQFIDTPEVEEIIDKTQFSAPFKPVEFSPDIARLTIGEEEIE